MKKILILLISLIVSINLVSAKELDYEILPYYVKIASPGKDKNIIPIKKVYDKETLNVVFNIDYQKYETNNNFFVESEVNYNNYGIKYRSLDFFNTIVYYGYNLNKNDLNYFFTQILIWSLVSNYNVSIVDEFGNDLDIYNTEYNKIRTKIINHNTESDFYSKKFNEEIWNTKIFKYYKNNTILDNPIIDGLTFKNNNYELIIYNEKVGNYVVELSKNYDQINFSYNDGSNIYWQSLGGPQNINKKFYYNVYGIKFNIVENLHGVGGKYGDAKLNSMYELYLNDELKLQIDDLNNNYIKSNSSYILKDISDSEGIYKIEDINFEVLNEDYELKVDKYIISKNISIDIKDNNKYYIYLKSNNELYEIIDKESSLITLPYGSYYLVSEDKSYYQEINVFDDIDECLSINNQEVLNKDNKETKELVSDNLNNEEILFDEKEEITTNEEIVTEEVVVNNPKTLDNFVSCIFLFNINFILLLILLKYCRKV